MHVREITVSRILTPTGGFLASYSHSLNPYRGCAYGSSLCGAACYAPEVRFGPSPGPWGAYLDVKVNAADVYPRDLARERRRCGRIVVFMASVTDPYVPQERRYRVTRRLLEAMTAAPPDGLVLQTHTPNALWDLQTLLALATRTRLVVQISVETDRDSIPGFPRHAYPVEARLDALRAMRARGLSTAAVVAPLMPLADPEGFAARLGEVADTVILDHYLVGDGSPGGARTRRLKAHLDDTVPNLLVAAGFAEWTRLEKFHEIVARFRAVLGPGRVGVSADGFNRALGAAPAR
jgi:DNA repair photolyase